MINKILEEEINKMRVKDVTEDGLQIGDLFAYNHALADLKSRIPQITERIIDEIEKEMYEYGFEEGDIKHFIGGITNHTLTREVNEE